MTTVFWPSSSMMPTAWEQFSATATQSSPAIARTSTKQGHLLALLQETRSKLSCRRCAVCHFDLDLWSPTPTPRTRHQILSAQQHSSVLHYPSHPVFLAQKPKVAVTSKRHAYEALQNRSSARYVSFFETSALPNISPNRSPYNNFAYQTLPNFLLVSSKLVKFAAIAPLRSEWFFITTEASHSQRFFSLSALPFTCTPTLSSLPFNSSTSPLGSTSSSFYPAAPAPSTDFQPRRHTRLARGKRLPRPGHGLSLHGCHPRPLLQQSPSSFYYLRLHHVLRPYPRLHAIRLLPGIDRTTCPHIP